MTLDFVYWFCMLLWVIFGLWAVRPQQGKPFTWEAAPSSIILFIMFLVIGFKCFGSPLKDGPGGSRFGQLENRQSQPAPLL